MGWLFGALIWVVASFPTPPGPGEYCTDGGSLLTAEHRGQINEIVARLVEEQRVPIHVVTVPSLRGLDVETFARRLFDEWGIGSAGHNFGVLLLVAQRDRRVRIEFGAGWKRERDEAAQEIVDRLLLPAFRDEDYSGGILLGVQGLDAMVRGAELPRAPGRAGSIVPWIIALVVVFFIVRALMDKRSDSWSRYLHTKAKHASRSPRSRALHYGGSHYWGGGFGGSSGGGGFSGGGGASGGW